MIFSFSVSGFASIKDTVSIDFRTPRGKRIKNTRYENNYFLDDRVTKSVVLFGKNATGKTNILMALNNLLNIIRDGLEIEEQAKYINSSLGYTHYTLQAGSGNEIYDYEIKFNSKNVLFEKLSKDDNLIYDFKDNRLNFPEKQEFEKLLSVASKDTILNKLEDNSFELFENFKGYFLLTHYSSCVNMPDVINEVSPDRIYAFQTPEMEILEIDKEEVLEILSMIDDSISDFKFIDNKDGRYALILLRGDEEFAFEKESSGVKKIVTLMVHVLVFLRSGGVLIVDELDSSISTISLINLLNGVINSSSNLRAQFIISSHNPLIFDTDMLAPAQIYIATKDELSTGLKTLDEYDLRNDKKKAYLNYLRGDYE